MLGPGYAEAETAHGWPLSVRRWPIWRHFLDYFPAHLIKTADLDPGSSYVFAAYPHGITAISGWAAFVAGAPRFERLFPGITAFPLTLASNFKAPLVREYCLAAGLRSCGRRACAALLSSRPGTAILLFPGGAAESLITRTGAYDIILAKRRGFVRVALACGAPLVPVLCFGETDLFRTHPQAPGSLGARLQQLSHRLWGTSQPVFSGDSLLAGHRGTGFMPFRTPLTTVVGAPVPLPRPRAPAPAAGSGADAGGAAAAAQLPPEGSPEFEALVDEYHGAYRAALFRLWERYKEELAPGRRGELRVVA